jgi:hypothetical protein
MKYVLFVLLLFNYKVNDYYVIRQSNLPEFEFVYKKATIKTVYSYLLTKVDSNKAVLLTAICNNETGFKKGSRYNNNNLSCMRLVVCKRAVAFDKAKYGVYNDWKDCLDDLVDYEAKEKHKMWYYRYKEQIKKSSNRVRNNIKGDFKDK